MSLSELTSRIMQSKAHAAIVVTSYRGNPGKLQFLDRRGHFLYDLFVESALLRREVCTTGRMRIRNLMAIAVLGTISERVREFGAYFANLLGVPFMPINEIIEMSTEDASTAFILLHEKDSKIHWTAYQSSDMVEIGPRIRISHIRSHPDEANE